MHISNCTSSHTNFKSNPLINIAAFLDSKLLINKAVVDASVDIPMVIMANNKDERAERFNRAGIAWSIAFLSPFFTLPLFNRFAMKHVAKLSPKFFSKESSLIELSNKYLVNKEETRKGLQELSLLKKTDYKKTIESLGGDYEKLRHKIINAKNSVLSFDFAFTAGSLGCIGFYNNWMTQKKTGRNGYSAEFKMADKSVVDKRAERYKNSEGLRKTAFAGIIGLLSLLPLALSMGLKSSSKNKLVKSIKDIAPKFDYNGGILMERVPLFLTALAAYTGLAGASRNETELKDNLIRAVVCQTVFFGGDIVIGSVLGRLSDKFLKTDIIKKDLDKTIMTKLIPPARRLKELEGRSKTIGAALFWVNLASLCLLMGVGTPYLINKMIRRDVKKDADKGESGAPLLYPVEAYLAELKNKTANKMQSNLCLK